jgi:hypothetical protein
MLVAGRTCWVGRTYCNVDYRVGPETSPSADLKFARIQLAGVLAEQLFDREHYRSGSSLDEIATAQAALGAAAAKSGRKPEALWLDMVAGLGATLEANQQTAEEIADVLMSKHVITGSRLKQALGQVQLDALHRK